jgi:hypothetical protein
MTVNVLVKKSISGNSQSGLTFYWLKWVFGDRLEAAVANAVRLVYFPSVLATSSKPWDAVAAEVGRCRLVFEQQALLTEASQIIEKPVPRRVNVFFDWSFDPSSYKAMTFDWLLSLDKDKIFNAIAYAVELVYLPSALASFPGRLISDVDESKRTRQLFEQMMSDAILSAAMCEVPFNQPSIVQPSIPIADSLCVTAPKELAVAPVERQETKPIYYTPELSGAEAVEEDFDDDFIDPNSDDED